jgi:DNA ligase (NAD+)
VIKVESLEQRRKMGENRHSVNWGIAFKFKDRAVETVITGIEESVGGSGQVTPIALIEPVRVDGAMLSRVNLHNHGLHLGLAVGDTVSVIRKAGVSPYISAVVKRSGKPGLAYPELCPTCKHPIRLNVSKIATTAFCDNQECSAKVISRLNHYVSRKALDVQGVAEDLIGKLHNLGKLLDVADFYSLQDFHLFEVGGVFFYVSSFKNKRPMERSPWAFTFLPPTPNPLPSGKRALRFASPGFYPPRLLLPID